jgi:hypothetical protein
LHGVSVVTDLENPPSDVLRVARQEILDIVAVDRVTPIVAEVSTDGLWSP